ncbi:MAG: flagellar hook assembly protein FlgD [Rhodocyclaceae bacterium]|nr:flagellar hook assembly protein FlgD [Rhodocyclaceae bacterium]
MATVSSTTGTTGNEYLASLGTNNSSSASVTDQIQDRFLKLLTTQLRNQDPLNPLDNAQMTSQLAQINTISGIEKMNATLGKMLDFYNAGQGMQAAGLIGKYVLVAGNNLTLANGQSAGGVLLKEAADQVTVSVLDGAGNVVQTQQLGAHDGGNLAFSWDGKKSDGTQMPAGNYRFSVSAVRGNSKVEATALQLGMVNAVTRSGSNFLLDLGQAGQVGFADVQQII